MSDGLQRVVSSVSHDDGTNAWSHVALSAPRSLAGLIDGYGDYRERTQYRIKRELPHADGTLIINLGDPVAVVGGDGGRLMLKAGEGFVAGAHLVPAFSCSDGSQSGVHVRLSLAAIRRLTGVPMSEMLDRVIGLDTLLGTRWTRAIQPLLDAETLERRIVGLDSLFRSLAETATSLTRPVESALDALRHRPDLDISEIARDIGWSRKHLADRVRDTVGLGPRSYRRLIRFQHLIARLDRPGDESLAALAADIGYADQSHLNREFREFALMTPGEYRCRLIPDGGGLVEA